ncbi:MAG: hypothetical protein D6819_10020 [Gammaproteobacteria bacterium]|nr:MAG: hypothetical protein D6819_10020 [Gammaproteobacteria bacterium]
MTSKRPVQIIGNIGLFYTCYRLSELGWNAMPTSRNARGIDIILFSMDGKKMFTIQVKSLSRKSPVPLGNSLDKIAGDFWVIVNEIASATPKCFILLPHEVRDLAHRGEKNGRISYWLQPKQYAVEAFEEKWGRIGKGL